MTTKTLDDVLLHLREMSHNTREQGDYFERLVARVLKLSPVLPVQRRMALEGLARTKQANRHSVLIVTRQPRISPTAGTSLQRGWGRPAASLCAPS
jgi:hypothetical protein